MPLRPDNSVLIHRRFDDFDDLSVAARHWDLDLMQLDRGEFEGEIVQAVSGNSVITSYSIHYTKLYDEEFFKFIP